MSHNYLNLAFHSSIVIILPSCITPLNIPSFDTFIRIFILIFTSFSFSNHRSVTGPLFLSPLVLNSPNLKVFFFKS